jgi:L-ascorbate metabolism protein UlaG (beta-lactamase superfamily)
MPLGKGKSTHPQKEDEQKIFFYLLIHQHYTYIDKLTAKKVA